MQSEKPNEKQIERFWKAFEEKKNIFLTGAGGTGKSFLIRELTKKYGKKRGAGFALTATTGIAAQNINGKTIHKFSGIRIGPRQDQSFDEFERILKKNKYIYEKNRGIILKKKVLLIDEISMMDSRTFDFLDFHLKEVRENDLPFGGLQLVVIGDFLQLEPINKDRENETCFSFESESWKEAEFETIYLRDVVRQNDQGYVEMLSRVRYGEITDTDFQKMRERFLPPKNDSVTRIYTTNRNVDEWNSSMLDDVDGEIVVFKAEVEGGTEAQQEALIKDMITPLRLELKIGAKVMVTANDPDEQYFNGQVGFIKKLNSSLIIVTLENGEEISVSKYTWKYDPDKKNTAMFSQYPLKLAWAVTAHKAQGVTLQESHVDCSYCFSHGQCYVALSRCCSWDGLTLEEFPKRSIMANPKAVNYYKRLEKLL